MLGSLDELDLIDGLGLGSGLAAHGLVAASRVVVRPATRRWRIDAGRRSAPVAESSGTWWPTAVAGRRAEFFAGRAAARAALAELGVAPVGIGRRADRSPDWPAGVIGSMTHTQGLVAVVVAGPDPARGTGAGGGRVGIGIDAEVDRPLPPAVADRVMDPAERAGLGPDAERDGVIVFSAKEAVFKALNPLTGRWLEFEDVSVRLVPTSGPTMAAGAATFEARLTSLGRGPADPSVVRGRWLRAERCGADRVPGRDGAGRPA